MPNYDNMSTPVLVALLSQWEEINLRKPTREVRAKITAIKKALAKAQVR